MSCAICGPLEETVLHILLACPMAMEIWEGNGFEEELWEDNLQCIRDVLERVADKLAEESMEEFVVVLWECWNARNLFILGKRDKKLGGLGGRAIRYVQSYRLAKIDDVQYVENKPGTTTYWRRAHQTQGSSNSALAQEGQGRRPWARICS